MLLGCRTGVDLGKLGLTKVRGETGVREVGKVVQGVHKERFTRVRRKLRPGRRGSPLKMR